MHLTQADKRAAKDGFKFLVLSPSGARKCYCTTVKEAKAEAGKGGKIVSLGRMRYTTRNPSSVPNTAMVGSRRLARKKSTLTPYPAEILGESYHPKAVVPVGISGEDLYGKVYLSRPVDGYTPLSSAESAAVAKLFRSGRRNPTAKRNPTVAVWDEPVVIGFKNGQKLFREKVPFPHPMYSSVKDMVADLYGGNPNIDEIKVLLNGKQYSYSLYKHGVGRAVASKTKAKKNPTARMVGMQPNPTWTTAAILAGAAYVYGRSAKVREKIKGAIDSAHKKLENPTARMVGMQRNPDYVGHATTKGEYTYVDTNFLNLVRQVPGVALEHMGFGEFYAKTPQGRVDFSRIHGEGTQIPGQVGRAHLLMGDKGADKWLFGEMRKLKLVKVSKGKAARPRKPLTDCATSLITSRWHKTKVPRTEVHDCAVKMGKHRWGKPYENPGKRRKTR